MMRRLQWGATAAMMVCLLCVPCPGQAPADHGSAAPWLAQGERALAEHDLAAAQRDFTRALRGDPKPVRAMIGLGEVAMQQGQWQQALSWLERAGQLDPGVPRIWLDRGLVACNLQKFDEGLKDFRHLLRLDPESREGQYLAGVTALYTGDGKAAFDYLLPLQDDPPNRLEYYYDLSTAAQMENNNALALVMLQKLKENGDGSPAYHLLLGRAYLNHNQPEQALPELQKVAAAIPRLPLLHFTLGIAFQNLHQDERARAEFEKDLELTPGNALDEQRLGEIDLRAHRDRQARSEELTAIRLAPDLALAQLELGTADLRLKRYDEAEQALRRAIRLYPPGARAHTLLGQVLQRTGHAQQAQMEFAEATRREQQNQGKLERSFAGGILTGMDGAAARPTHP